MKNQMLYRELAKYYNLIYSFKDYKKEAGIIRKLILKYKKSGGNYLLEAGCGTGKHLKYFENTFSCTGIDVNKGMLRIARKSAKRTFLKKDDMVNFSLNKKFDVILSLFSSIGYVKTYKNLEKAIHNFSNHLKSGGVLIIEPWLTKKNFRAGTPHMATFDSKNIKIARLNISRIKNDISIIDMHYLIAEKNKKVRHFTDRHELGLFDIDRTLKIMKKEGLEARFSKNGLMKDRGLFIGVKK